MTMVVVHLTSSTFFGGPEKQMLGLARSLPADYRTTFLSFREGDQCHAFLDAARGLGFAAEPLRHDTPHFLAALGELVEQLRALKTDVLCVHGYKAGILGRLAARRLGIPVVAISRGWTGESRKVRLYEALDRINLRWMDRVVCVSASQAAKVRRAGVPADRVLVIPNAIQSERFASVDPSVRHSLSALFVKPPSLLIGAAGRLSPEKGFEILIEAAALVRRDVPSAGFVVFGAGFRHDALTGQIARRGLEGRFVLAGFRSDLDQLVPCLDLLVSSSFTEGMPNVVLEALAAGVPVVATAVGGTPEVVADGANGFLVPPGDPPALARRILELLRAEETRTAMGDHGRHWVRERFSFEAQSARYQQLFQELAAGSTPSRVNRPEPLACPASPNP